MQDCYNLGWKVALVAKGIADRKILGTYQIERRRVAQDLIDFDHRFSRLFSGRPAKDVIDAEGVSIKEFKEAFQKGILFTSGLSINYGPSSLVFKAVDAAEHGDGNIVTTSASVCRATPVDFQKRQALASGIPVGMRFNSFKVLNQADARAWHFQERLKADGRFRVVLFAGNILDSAQKARVEAFCQELEKPERFLRAATPSGAAVDSVIEVLTIHSSKRADVELLRDIPTILHPFDKHNGWDYNKVFVDDISYHDGFGAAYDNYGVDKGRGCVVAVRPDQYVGWIGEIEDFDGLQKYFRGFLLFPKGG